uniref:Uncharacterized protein n=1 Tax=Chromera velia CCMP2878 TaxID=1169474 RepID=A0A0G4H9P6_9ALVE|eukprot:Cvel_25470.t1-p1 / transcript=Cvel_25470.t1 / gene=Cvel_25470 / organism=Chromera_velia_CCMP2878 / gene_product=hypothetical protein / transcript_product=hypothetical protein / location=Cvel_scaffold2891:9469-10884(-) / protein_length=472 / sequence_SO=supercontig / SO=protein_coding / is_pseudo=false
MRGLERRLAGEMSSKEFRRQTLEIEKKGKNIKIRVDTLSEMIQNLRRCPFPDGESSKRSTCDGCVSNDSISNVVDTPFQAGGGRNERGGERNLEAQEETEEPPQALMLRYPRDRKSGSNARTTPSVGDESPLPSPSFCAHSRSLPPPSIPEAMAVTSTRMAPVNCGSTAVGQACCLPSVGVPSLSLHRGTEELSENSPLQREQDGPSEHPCSSRGGAALSESPFPPSRGNGSLESPSPNRGGVGLLERPSPDIRGVWSLERLSLDRGRVWSLKCPSPDRGGVGSLESPSPDRGGMSSGPHSFGGARCNGVGEGSLSQTTHRKRAPTSQPNSMHFAPICPPPSHRRSFSYSSVQTTAGSLSASMQTGETSFSPSAPTAARLHLLAAFAQTVQTALSFAGRQTEALSSSPRCPLGKEQPWRICMKMEAGEASIEFAVRDEETSVGELALRGGQRDRGEAGGRLNQRERERDEEG